MNNVLPMKTSEILRRLDIMSESGGMLTKDRLRTVREAAARIRELDDAVNILKSHNGGDVNEEH